MNRKEARIHCVPLSSLSFCSIKVNKEHREEKNEVRNELNLIEIRQRERDACLFLIKFHSFPYFVRIVWFN